MPTFLDRSFSDTGSTSASSAVRLTSSRIRMRVTGSVSSSPLVLNGRQYRILAPPLPELDIWVSLKSNNLITVMMTHCFVTFWTSDLTFHDDILLLRAGHAVRVVGVGVHGQEGGLHLRTQEGEDRHGQAESSHHHQCKLYRWGIGGHFISSKFWNNGDQVMGIFWWSGEDPGWLTGRLIISSFTTSHLWTTATTREK